jgi:hypothetical protein
MSLTRDLQIIVTLMVVGDVILRISQDAYGTRKKQKTRKGLLKLNWVIPDLMKRVEKQFFQKRHTSFTNLLDNKFSIILKWSHNPQTKYSIQAAGGVIVVVVLGIILTGIMMKKFIP